MNDPDYAYSKKYIYAEEMDGSYGIPHFDGYDQKGRLWKTFNGAIRYLDTASFHRNYWGFCYSNYIESHYSAGDWRALNLKLSEVVVEDKQFTVRELLKRAR
ncbi:MAG: hypothetical protein SV062_05245 [Thermodesulfobacteriota bacterium]|nr:hypothetical protein [Thermodesulfobacteriota bacterium]